MTQAFWNKLDRIARHLAPFLMTTSLLVLNHVPLHIAGLSRITPVLAMIAVFHWGIFRPDLLPVYAVFIIGLLQDFLGGGALGVWTFIFLIVYKVAMLQRRFFVGKGFVLVWLGFGVLSAGAMFSAWFLNAVLFGVFSNIQAPFYQFFVTLGFYGPVGFIFLRCQQMFLARD